jgi:hypothetical protein
MIFYGIDGNGYEIGMDVGMDIELLKDRPIRVK